MFVVLAVALLAADPVTPAVTPEATPAPPSSAVVHLGDPAFSSDLKGAVVFVKKKSGALVQGLVTSASETELVVDGTMHLQPADVASLYTLRPARFPVGIGNVVAVTLNGTGAPYRGRVVDLSDDHVTLQYDGKDAKMKWAAIATIEVVVADPPETVAHATPAPAPTATPIATATATATPAPIATPVPTPWTAVARAKDGGKRYGNAGTLEIGGTFDFFNGNVSEKTSTDEASASGYTIDARPFIGYFFLDGLEVFAELTLISSATDYHDGGDDWSTFSQLGAGAAYFLRTKKGTSWGPFARVAPYSRGNETQDVSGISFDFEERGTSFDGGLALRVPLGESALFSASFSLYQSRYTFDYYPGAIGSKGEGQRSGFETQLGFSVWR